MSWYDTTLNGFEGLNQFLGQVIPYLLPLLVALFLGALVLRLVKGVAVTTT